MTSVDPRCCRSDSTLEFQPLLMKRIGIVADCEPVLSPCWYLAPRWASVLRSRERLQNVSKTREECSGVARTSVDAGAWLKHWRTSDCHQKSRAITNLEKKSLMGFDSFAAHDSNQRLSFTIQVGFYRLWLRGGCRWLRVSSTKRRPACHATLPQSEGRHPTSTRRSLAQWRSFAPKPPCSTQKRPPRLMVSIR
jgi:hypothetical protein